MPALHQRLHFDTARGQVLDADRRYVLLRTDVLMGLFEELPAAARTEALRAFGRAVARRGAESVRAYAGAVGNEGLPALMEGAAASLGWGRWELTARAPAGATASGDAAAASWRLAVENSPFAAASAPGATGPVCHAIAGMLEAVAGALGGRPAAAREIRCAAEHGGDTCHFVAEAVASGSTG